MNRLEKLARDEGTRAGADAAKGEVREAKTEISKTKLDLAPKLYSQLALTAINDHRYQDALDSAESAIQSDPQFAGGISKKAVP